MEEAAVGKDLSIASNAHGYGECVIKVLNEGDWYWIKT